MAALSFALFSPVATEQAAPSSAAHRPHGLLHAPGSWRASELFTLGDLGVLNAPSSIVGVVPKNIFTYWDDPNNIPDLVAGCIARMHHFNPDWTIYLLYPGVPNVEPPPQKMANACCGGFDDPTHQADWYRSAALAKYGGVWLDSTSIVNQPIDRWADLDMDAVQGWEWVGGNLAMENWGFVVPYKSQLMATWMEEMRNAWQMGPELYCANIPQPVQISSSLRSWLPYLTMHACFVVSWTLLPTERVRFIASSSDPGQPFNFLAMTNWDTSAALNLIFFQMNQTQISNTTFFKLRGDERHAAQSLASYASQGSLLAREMLALLPPSPPPPASSENR